MLSYHMCNKHVWSRANGAISLLVQGIPESPPPPDFVMLSTNESLGNELLCGHYKFIMLVLELSPQWHPCWPGFQSRFLSRCVSWGATHTSVTVCNGGF